MEIVPKLIPWSELYSNKFVDVKVGKGIEVGDMIAWPTSRGPNKKTYYLSPVRRVTPNGIVLMNKTIGFNGFIKNGAEVKIKK